MMEQVLFINDNISDFVNKVGLGSCDLVTSDDLIFHLILTNKNRVHLN